MRADAGRNRIRILETAEAVFAEAGASASTEDIARRAGVAVGTVFRHFPTKNDLLRAVVKNVQARLFDDVRTLVEHGDAADGPFALFTRVVELAADNRELFDRLAETGVAVHVGDAVEPLRAEIAELVERARTVGAIRADVGVDEVLALLAATGQGALSGAWDADLRRRTLAVVFAGLRSG